MNPLKFFVPGIPIQQGSARAFCVPNKFTGKYRAIITSDTRRDLKGWRENIATEALGARNYYGSWPMDAAGYFITVTFWMPRPKSVPVNKRPFPNVTPDLDKLIRGNLDALTGILYDDDSSVTDIHCRKRYADHLHAMGADIHVRTLTTEDLI